MISFTTPQIPSPAENLALVILVGLTVNILHGYIQRYWDLSDETLDHEYRARRRRDDSPGRMSKFLAGSLLLVLHAIRRKPTSAINRLEQLLLWVTNGDTLTVEILQDEALYEKLSDNDQVAQRIWTLQDEVAERLASPIGRTAGLAVGLGALAYIPLALTEGSLGGVPARTGGAVFEALGFLLISIGTVRWSSAAKKDPTFSSTVALRQSVTLLMLGLPVTLFTFKHVHFSDMFVFSGMMLTLVGIIALALQTFVPFAEVVRRGGLAFIAVGTAAIAAGDIYWVFVAASGGAWLWVVSLTLLICGTACTSVSAALGSRLESLQFD